MSRTRKPRSPVIHYGIKVDGLDGGGRLAVGEDDFELISNLRSDTPEEAVARIARLARIGTSVIGMIYYLKRAEQDRQWLAEQDAAAD